MKANLKRIQKQRVYSEVFKKDLVSDFETGKFSVPDLEKLHGIGNATIYEWIYKYSTFNEKGYRIIEMKDSSIIKVKELEARIKDLEGTVGRKQIMIDYLETMIDVAKEDLDIDIKKNYSTSQSVKSNRKKRN